MTVKTLKVRQLRHAERVGRTIWQQGVSQKAGRAGPVVIEYIAMHTGKLRDMVAARVLIDL